jgi:hypothetical protein
MKSFREGLFLSKDNTLQAKVCLLQQRGIQSQTFTKVS